MGGRARCAWSAIRLVAFLVSLLSGGAVVRWCGGVARHVSRLVVVGSSEFFPKSPTTYRRAARWVIRTQVYVCMIDVVWYQVSRLVVGSSDFA